MGQSCILSKPAFSDIHSPGRLHAPPKPLPNHTANWTPSTQGPEPIDIFHSSPAVGYGSLDLSVALSSVKHWKFSLQLVAIVTTINKQINICMFNWLSDDGRPRPALRAARVRV